MQQPTCWVAQRLSILSQCDILIAPHPELTRLWFAFDEHGKGDRALLIDSSACKRYAAAAKTRFDRRLEGEGK